MDIFTSSWFASALNLVSAYAATSSSSLVRRSSMVHTTSFYADESSQPHNSMPSTTSMDLSKLWDSMDHPWVGVLVVLTDIIALIITLLAGYTLKVILTLCIVEESPPVYLPLGSEDLLDERNPKPAGTNTPRIYITNSIRGTIRHLRSEAGPFSLWRGWNAHISYMFTVVVLRSILQAIIGGLAPEFVARPISGFLAPLLLARFSMTITHIIISKNQPKTTWFSRTLATPWSAARRTIPAIAHLSFTTTVACEFITYGTNTQIHIGARTALLIASIFIGLFITFPMMVALIRVQASLLPDSQEGIVSFDRTFGSTDDTMGLSFKKALKSVGCAGWKRIVKLAVKSAGLMFGLSAIVGAIVGIEMIWVH